MRINRKIFSNRLQTKQLQLWSLHFMDWLLLELALNLSPARVQLFYMTKSNGQYKDHV